MVKVARPYAFGFLALGFACAGGLQTARAQELADPRDKADRLCASYGRGFVAGHAPGHCVTVPPTIAAMYSVAAAPPAPPGCSSFA